MTRICWIYSEQELTPRAAEVISQIKRENGYEDVLFRDATNRTLPPGTKVLVFGSKAPEGVWSGVEFIHTYSIAQIMGKANAVTVLVSALQLYFNGKHEVPEGVRPMFSASVTPLTYWDYDAPTVIDIETSGNLGKTHTPEEVALLSVAFYQEGRRPFVVVSHREDGTDKWTHPFDNSELELLAEVLPKFTKAIYHNGKFDTRVLNRVLGVRLCVWFDTMLAHHVLNHAAGDHKLKHLAQRYLGAPEWEKDLGKYTKGGGYYELIPRNKLVEYNGWDVYWTFQLWKLFAPQIESDDNNQMAFMFEMQAAEMLLKVEEYGIPFDSQAARELADLQEQIMDNTRHKLRGLTDNDTFNPNSPKQVKVELEKLGVYVPSTSADEIDTIKKAAEQAGIQRVVDFCDYLIAYRKASKIKGTYADGWAKHARYGRVHPTFLVHGTSTGRLSSTGPNAQNVPRNKEVRKIVSLTKEHHG